MSSVGIPKPDPRHPVDPVTFTVVSALLIGIGLLGSYVPARRALRVDPTVALRVE